MEREEGEERENTRHDLYDLWFLLVCAFVEFYFVKVNTEKTKKKVK